MIERMAEEQKQPVADPAMLKLAEERAELDRQLSDPKCSPEKAAELTDELSTVDMAMGPLRK